MFKIFSAVILTACAAYSLAAGEFEDFERLAKDVSKHYSSAKGARESSSAEADFTAKISDFQKAAERMEQHMKTLSLGDDFEFTYYAAQIDSAYKRREKRFDFDKRGGSINEIIDPEIIFDLLKHDLKILNDMEFTVDASGIPSINRTWLDFRAFLRYKRIFDFIVKESTSLDKKADSYSWRKNYQKRLLMFVEAGDSLDNILRRNNPEYAAKLNLARETKTIDAMARSIIEARGDKKVSRLTDIGTKYAKDPAGELKYSADKIEAELRKAEKELRDANKKRRRTSKNKKTEPTITETPVLAYFSVSGKAPAPPETEKEKANEPETPKDNSETDTKDFSERIAKYRVFSNVMLDGLSDENAELFKMTLTSELKNEFVQKAAEAAEAGKSQARANASAYIAMQNKLKRSVFSEREKAAILEKIDAHEGEKE